MHQQILAFDNSQLFFNEVVLAGNPDYLPLYYAVMKNMGVEIRAVISEEHVDEVEGKAIPFNDYMLKRELHRTPIIILDSSDGGISRFFIISDRLIEAFHNRQTQLPPIYHSAILAGILCDTGKGYWLNSGYAGTGQTIVANILEEILELKPDVSDLYDPLCRLIVLLGEYMHFSMRVACDRLLLGLDVDRVTYMAGLCPWISHAKAILKDKTTVTLFNFPRTFFAGRPVVGHFFWTRYTRLLFDRMGYNCFFTLRNPFDTIASNAAKYFRPVQKMLYDDRFFLSVAKQYSLHLSFALEHSGFLNFVKYDDLIADPVNQILRIAEVQDVEISEETASKIWDELGFKPLKHTTNSSHLYRPGESKLKYFTRRQAGIMESLGLKKLAAEFGYDWPDMSSLRDEPMEYDQSSVRRTNEDELYGRCDPERWNLYKYRDPYSGILAASSTQETLEQLKKNIQTQPSVTLFCRSLNDIFGPQTTPDILLETNLY